MAKEMFTVSKEDLREAIIGPLLLVMGSYIPLETAQAVADELADKEIEKLKGKQQ